MHTKKNHEGYLLIDNRFSPGVSADFVQASGKNVPSVPEGALYESATVTCSHCHRIVILNPQRTRPRNYCAHCDHYICDTAGCLAGCLPMTRRLDTLQEHAFRQETLMQRG